MKITPFLRVVAYLAVFFPWTLRAQTISPYLVGTNLWYATPSNAAGSPSTTAMNLAGAANIRLIRIGGHSFDATMPSNAALLTWVDRIRAIGAEPLVQVSEYSSAATAASAVTFLNVTNKRAVRYWCIGNEPWLQAGQTTVSEADIADTIEIYFKDRSAAMKAVDSSIKIFGFDSEDFQVSLYNRLFGGGNNIAGLVPGQSYYYCDGISWHRYPQSDSSVLRPELEGLNDLRTRIQNCASLLASVNAKQGRTGDAALLWGIGEFNAKNGTGVHTFGNGQMFAGVYGLAMKYGATYATSWSLRESEENNRGPADYSLLDTSALVPRSSYWHTQLIGRYFTGRYLEGNLDGTPSIISSSSNILVFGAEDTALGRVSVMIMNRGATAQPYTLHLNATGTYVAPGAIAVRVDAARADSYSDTLAPNSTQVLVFGRDSLTRVAYAKTDFEAATPIAPQTTVIPRTTALGTIDGFDAYTNFSQQGYWTPQHLSGGAATVATGSLVLRTTNAAYSTAAVASPVSPAFNFFNRGFTVSLTGFALSAGELAAADTHFRLSLNSSGLRSFRANDSLALRITPSDVRLGFKINQNDVQGELRAGAAAADGFLDTLPYAGRLSTVRLALEPDPAGPVAGVSTIRYTLLLEGSFGRLYRSGAFAATLSDWGTTGDSALVLESRRENAAIGVAGSFVETRIDAVANAALVFDDFSGYASLAAQSYWQTLFVGGNSTAAIATETLTLRARADSFASASLAGPVSPDLNFFQNAYTLELRDLGLTSAGLTADQSVFRLSLNSTSARSFTSPDALTLRINPDRVVLGFKLDQASADAEFRTGTATTLTSLLDFNPGGAVTDVRLTLAPMGPPPALGSSNIYYALHLEGGFGIVERTGVFSAERSRWGSAGDSALVIEARRNNGTAGTTATLMQATVGDILLGPIPDDLFATVPNYAAWQMRNFDFVSLIDPSAVSPTATPAGDGTPNLLKYAFGLDPALPATPGLLPEATLADGLFHLTHEERAGAADLDYIVEASTDLTAWTIPTVEESRGTPIDGWIRVITRADLPLDQPRIFLRVRVNRQ